VPPSEALDVSAEAAFLKASELEEQLRVMQPDLTAIEVCLLACALVRVCAFGAEGGRTWRGCVVCVCQGGGTRRLVCACLAVRRRPS
jgi:hypothetical protein